MKTWFQNLLFKFNVDRYIGDIDELSDGSPMSSAAYHRIKPDVSMFAMPDGNPDGQIPDMSKLSAREVAALVPPAFNFPSAGDFDTNALEITNWDTSDSEADPGSPELRRQLPPAPIRKIDKMWGGSSDGS
jgi:hypothetical protein